MYDFLTGPDGYLILRLAHIIGATVLFGTGSGIAFFMLMAQRSKDVRVIAYTAGIVVLADFLFTTSAVIVQPLTGLGLIWTVGYGYLDSWIVAAVGLYIFTGIFWLPVVWIQLQLRDIARRSVEENTPLPERYHRLFRIWFACGFPAFTAVFLIFILMIWKPVLW